MKETVDAILRPEQAAYLLGLEPARDALLTEMEAYAREHNQPISDPEVASFLAVVARARRPETIVEVGTNIGYGTIVLARAAGPSARVVSIDNDPAICGVARAYIARDDLDERVEVRCGDALKLLRDFESQIDLVYLDCVKEDYPAYLALALPKLSERGVVIADNVLWKGYVAASDPPERERERVAAIRKFNEALVSDARLRGVVLPLGDGVGFAVRT